MSAEEAATSAEEASVTFHIKSAGNAKYTVTLPLSTTALDLKNKLSTSEYANVPATSQRLIYSGRVLKDDDTLASHGVKEGNTMHLVKSAASNQRQNPANQTSASSGALTGSPPPAASGVPQNLAAGTGNNPLAGLTGARYAGYTQLPSASMFGADGGMGAPQAPEEMLEQLSNPQFQQMMNEALQNPQFIDIMIQQNPQLRSMGPQARQMMQSEQFRRMMTDPAQLRQMFQFQRMMGMGPFGGAGGGQEEFPMPGATTTTDSQNRDTQTPEAQQQIPSQQPHPLAALMGGMGGGAGANPFAGMYYPQAGNTNPSTTNPSNTATTENQNQTQQQQQQQPANPFAAILNNPGVFPPHGGDPNNANNPFNPQNNPFLQNPQMLQQFMQAMGGGGGAGSPNAGGNDPTANLMNLLGGMGGMPGGGGFGGPPDNRPPEERYATQLGQLNEMGFHDFDRNVQALRRSGGDVNGALEWLFSQP